VPFIGIKLIDMNRVGARMTANLDAPHTTLTAIFAQSLRRNPYIGSTGNRKLAMKNFLIGTSVMCAIMVLAVMLRALLFLPGRLDIESARAQAQPAKQAEYSRCAQRPVKAPCMQQDGPRS
jgi:hypothetical protein